jgi:hypothetical protein
MAQHDYIISNQTFPNTRADLNNVLQAIATCNKGSSAPTTQYAGQMWIDDSAGTTWTLYLYDGSDNIQVATIDTTANTINFIDSVVTGFDIVTDTTPQLGGDLDTNGNNINLGDNDKINVGASNDLQIYHDGSNSYIDEVSASGSFSIRGNNLRLRGDDDSNYLVGVQGSTVKLYHNNIERLSTTGSGVDVTGVAVTDGVTSSGDVLVNTTSTTLTDLGVRLRADINALNAIRDGNPSLYIGRNTTNGDISRFYKDGTQIGTIGTTSSNLYIGTSDTGIFFNSSEDKIYPINTDTIAGRDSAVSLGKSDTQFKDLYLSGGAVIKEATLTDGATISWDVSTSSVAKVTLGGNRTISAPSNALNTGQFISLLVIQDGTGSRTLTWNAVYEFASDTAPTLTTTASKGDLFVFRYNGTKWLEVGRNLNLTLS